MRHSNRSGNEVRFGVDRARRPYEAPQVGSTQTTVLEVPSAPIRVASVPADHVYVRHLSRPAGTGTSTGPAVLRLPDPTQPWWPPAMLEPDWVRAHHAEFDIFHIHFGFDACAPAALRELLHVLRAAGKPLVLTVHDLRNPHHETRAAHDEHLDILVPAASALITLTEGAAEEIHRRWGRVARVIPHPHVVELADLDDPEQGRRVGAPRQIGLHLKSMRPCMSGIPMVVALSDAVRELNLDGTAAELRVDLHHDVADADGARHDPELLSALRRAEAAGAQLEVHDFFSDDELWSYLRGLDASVLPYRYGTHSGWLEACRDLGVPVVAPTCGQYADQGPVHSFDLDENRLDARSLTRAVRSALVADRPRPLGAGMRATQRLHISDGHEEIYLEVLR